MDPRAITTFILLVSPPLGAAATAAPPPATSLPASDATRAGGLSELRKREPDSARIDHALAVEAIMRELALMTHADANEWGLAGLLHDIDLAETRTDMSLHGVVGARILVELGFSPSVAHAVEAHDDRAGVPRTRPIDHALFCADQAYWAIRSSGLRFPSPDAAPSTPSSVIRNLEHRGAANKIDDRLLQACAALGLTLDDLLRLSLHAMQSLAQEVP